MNKIASPKASLEAEHGYLINQLITESINHITNFPTRPQLSLSYMLLYYNVKTKPPNNNKTITNPNSNQRTHLITNPYMPTTILSDHLKCPSCHSPYSF